MTIDELKTAIQNIIKEEPEIVSVFLTGSKVFLNDAKDTDYNVIIKNATQPFRVRDNDNSIDYFVESEANRNKILSFTHPKPIYTLYCIDELFKPNNTIYGDSTCNLDLLGNAQAYKQSLKQAVEKSVLSPYIKWANSDLYCNKRLWYAILGLHFIENQSYEITSEMKQIAQYCHDGILNKSWEEWVHKCLSSE